MKIFTIYDEKTEVYERPFCMATSAAALRVFADMVNDKGDNLISTHPSDFYLYEIGSFDVEDGTIELLPALKRLGCGEDYVREVL